MQKALIDADVLLYRCGHQAEVVTDWGDDVFTLHADGKEAKSRFLALVENSTPPGRSPVLCMSDSPTVFRHTVYPEYKANRKGSRKPLTHKMVREWILDGCPEECYGGDARYEVIQWPGLEADDVMGIMATRAPDSIICTIDKDLRTVPGLHYNFDKPEEGVVRVSPEEAERFFLQQCVSGDATDGIPGIKGVGPKKAAGLLDRFGWNWEGVRKAYEHSGYTLQDALVNSWLVRILTDGLYMDLKVRLPNLVKEGSMPVDQAMTHWGIGKEDYAV